MYARTARLALSLAAGTTVLVTSGTAVASKPAVGPAPPKLAAVIDVQNRLSLTSHGKAVAHLASGWYTLTIKNSSYGHRFQLKGPGINRSTGTHFVGAAIWGIQLQKGKYTYSSLGAHTVSRSFSVG